MNASSISRSRIEVLGTKGTAPQCSIQISWWHLGVVGWLVLDSICAFLTVLCACWLSPVYDFWRGTIPTDPNFSPIRVAAGYALVFAIISHVFGLQNPLMRREKVVMIVKCVSVAALAVILTAVIELMFFYTRVGRHILAYAFLLSGVTLPLLRMVLWRVTEERKRRVAVVGPSAVIEGVQSLITSSGIPYEMVPCENLEHALRLSQVSREHWPDFQRTAQAFCPRGSVDEIVVACTESTPRHELAGLSEALMSGVQVSDYSTFIERTFFRVPVEQISPEWFFRCNTSPDYALYQGAKRLADLFFGAVGLVAAAPLLLACAVLIWIESRGPVFYSQVRVGHYGRPFKIWKLRSMRSDAEKAGPRWAQKQDCRVTRFGRFLRLTRLDELPQFYNVLRGEMSFVGPRPERLEFVEQLAQKLPFYHQRHLVRPGITGWAQMNYPYGANAEDALNKLRYDLYYVKHASPLLDLQIILRTIGAVMKGAR